MCEVTCWVLRSLSAWRLPLILFGEAGAFHLGWSVGYAAKLSAHVLNMGLGQHASDTMATSVLKMKRTIGIKCNALELAISVSTWDEEPIRGEGCTRQCRGMVLSISFDLTAFVCRAIQLEHYL